jgi:transcription initiation factor TFIID TATA-box-binding protein
MADDSNIVIKIQNVVITINLGVKLDLVRITQTARNAEYNPTRFQAVIMRIREPKATSLMFGSGKIIVTGTKNEDDCMQAAQKFVKILEKVGYPVNATDLSRYQYKIQNMTATCDFGFPIGLEALILSHSSFATYEPELFAGLVYRLQVPKVVLLIFVSGKVVLTGAKCQEDLCAAYEAIHPILLECRRKQVTAPTS